MKNAFYTEGSSFLFGNRKRLESCGFQDVFY
jgi:hypothetical protein